MFARRDLAGSSHREERLIGVSHPPVAGRGRLAGGHDILPRFPCPWPGSLWHLGAPCRGHCPQEVPGSGQLCAFLPPPCSWCGRPRPPPAARGTLGRPSSWAVTAGPPRQVTWENVPAAPAGGRGTAGHPRLAGDERAVGASGRGQGRGGEGTSAVCCHRTTPRGGAPPAGWTGLACWTAAPHQRGSPAPGASPGTSHRGAGPALRPVAAWTMLPGWGHPPGLHLGLAAWFARAEHATQSRQQAANGSPSHQQAQRESCPQAFLPHRVQYASGDRRQGTGKACPAPPRCAFGDCGQLDRAGSCGPASRLAR